MNRGVFEKKNIFLMHHVGVCPFERIRNFLGHIYIYIYTKVNTRFVSFVFIHIQTQKQLFAQIKTKKQIKKKILSNNCYKYL